MIKKVLLAVLITLCALPGPAYGAGYFGRPPFRVKKELALNARHFKAASLLPRLQIEGEHIPMTEYGAETTREQGDREKWNELQYGRLHLFFSRYHDRQVYKGAMRPAGEMDLSAMRQYLQIPSDGDQFRHTLDNLGRVFTPQLDLGIEF